MESARRTTAEALKQRKTRNIKAECISELVALTAALGVRLRFHKTKRSSFAQKLYIADTVEYDRVYAPDEVLGVAVGFECVMRRLWDRAKRQGLKVMELGWGDYAGALGEDGMDELIRSKLAIVTDDTKLMACSSLWGDSSLHPTDVSSAAKTDEYIKKRKTRNREAAFASFLSYVLLKEGFRLRCQISAQKIASKTLNFYLWKHYAFPDGRERPPDVLHAAAAKVREFLKAQFISNLLVVVSRETLLALPLTPPELDALGVAQPPPRHPPGPPQDQKKKEPPPKASVLHFLGF